MRYSVTGPVDLTRTQEHYVRARIQEVLLPRLRTDLEAEFTSGAAIGVDTVAFLAAMGLPFKILRLTVPAAPHNEALTYVSSARMVIERALPGRTRSDCYMNRNVLTIHHTDVLLAFPLTMVEEERRSGTWATIRRARKAGCEVWFYPLAAA